jgi:type I restriction enzyme M protein
MYSETQMPSKRQLLEVLTRTELVDLVNRFELEVEDRRSKDLLIEAVTQSRRASLADALPTYSRDRLKELCAALGLDADGREKAVLIERLLGAKGVADGSGNGKNGRSRRPAPEQVELPSNGKLTVDQLERYLWSAADILRGSIDSSDYKSFIFGLLFLKRLSDRFEEEAEKLVALGLSADVAWNDPDEHQFFVPQRARWSAIQKTATNIGEALNKACAVLEERNASLEGVLAGIDYNDERKLGDTKNRDTVLARLVQHFSQLSLRNDHLSEPDLLGRAYEYLIEKFADDAGKKGGEFYTPRKVVQLIVEVLAPQEKMRVCDPTCGSGGMLIECAHYIERHGGNLRNLTLHGQEKNLGTWAICKMNMLLHGLPDARIEKGDTLRDPKLVHEGELILYDRVIANPPFSLDEWGRDVAEHDGYGRFRFGIPPKTKADLAFVQHMVAVLNGTGQLGVVMPHGVLFRGAAEGEIRQGMLKEDLFEAVIGLPPNLFYGTGIPAAILVLNRSKPAARQQKVLFIDASHEYEEGSNQNYLRDDDVKKIAATFHAFKDVEKYARVVPLDEIEKNEWNLNISRYVDTADAEERIDVAAAVRRLCELEKLRAEAEERMNRYLAELGYE